VCACGEFLTSSPLSSVICILFPQFPQFPHIYVSISEDIPHFPQLLLISSHFPQYYSSLTSVPQLDPQSHMDTPIKKNPSIDEVSSNTKTNHETETKFE